MIDRDTVVRLAKEAGLAISIDGGDTYFVGYQAERFATLIANETLERAAKVCEEYCWYEDKDNPSPDEQNTQLAKALRALKEKP